MDWAYLDQPIPFGIAHRGGDTGPPENTIAAFTNAVALGYLYLETDVHLSSDGVLVAFHDIDLSRLLGRDVAIGGLPWSEISEIDLGDGHRIPRLDQLFETFPTSRFNIDPKSDDAVEPLAKLVQEYDMTERVGIGSFVHERITRSQALLGPALCTSPGPTGAIKVIGAAIFRPQWQSPYGCLQIPTSWNGLHLANGWLIKRIHRLGVQVHFWTVNDPDEMNRLLDLGADAIISDNVNALRTVLAQRQSQATNPNER